MICPVCRESLSTHRRPPLQDGSQKLGHHCSWDGLKTSTEGGCYICNEFWKALADSRRRFGDQTGAQDDHDKFDSEHVDTQSQDFITTITLFDFADNDGRYPGCLIMVVALMHNPHGLPGATCAFMLDPHEEPTELVSKSLMSSSTRSAETLSLAKQWVADCLTTHEHCGSAARETPWCPSRLLHWENSDDLMSLFRIVESKDLHEPYMTLSHCWGNVKCLSLDTDNYAQLHQGLPIGNLPILYRDAIHIAQQLDIKHLWIDSLCIIQRGDNLEDWRRESSLMDKVYSGAFCNISASHAPNSNCSLFSDRNPTILSHGASDIEVGTLGLYGILHLDLWTNQVFGALVNTRGWVMQERLLSPRILYFGERQIFWECRQKTCAENYPRGLPRGVHVSVQLLKKHTAPPSNTDGGAERWPPDSYSEWDDIVASYAACNLTFSQDKLIAISAVAKTMQPILNDQYIAGMWRRYLEHELLWKVDDRSRTRTSTGAPQPYRAPSWSWAAVDDPVIPGRIDLYAEFMLEVNSYKLDYTTSDEFGLIEGGWLQLWGILKPLKLLPLDPSSNLGQWAMVVNGVNISMPAGDESYFEPRVMLDCLHTDFEEQNNDAVLFCVPASWQPIKPGGDGLIYLLLLELIDHKTPTYRRIGLARGWGDEMWARFMANRVDGRNLPCVAFRDGRHLIRIV